jgi:hypothetical protein
MSRLIRGNEKAIWSNWNSATAALHMPQQGAGTTWKYIGPNGAVFDLEGRDRGKQGVRLTPELAGAYGLPFEHLFTETAYQEGATYERSNILKRVISLGVMLGGPKYSMHAFRMIETNWWNAWPHNQPGWLGAKTMFGGWRWAKVMLAEPTKGSVRTDPAAHKNNLVTTDMQIVAAVPWYCKPMLYTTWKPHADTITALGRDTETIAIANRGHMPVSPLFLVGGPGTAHVQDGMLDRMVRLPKLIESDGYGLVDTNESARTLTATHDPIDNAFYDLIRSGTILNFLLHDLGAQGVPWWRRANAIRFFSQIPPRTVANIKVQHDNPAGSVTVMMPQRFVRPS